MRYRPLSSSHNLGNVPLSREERDANAVARVQFRQQARDAAAAEADARAAETIERINAATGGSVRGLDRRSYTQAKRETLAALRTVRR
jgi:hypothetical protein